MTDPATSPKLPPESLLLRGKPRRAVRFKRNVLMGAAAVGFLAIVGCAWIGLGKHHAKPAGNQPELFNPDKAADAKKPAPDHLQALPATYSALASSSASAIPVLGPPLPGDLGKPILEQQQARLKAGDAAGAGAGPQAAAARQAGVFFKVTDKSVVGDALSSLTGAQAAAVASPAASPASSLTLDLDKDQNTQGRKLDFAGKADNAGIYNSHDLELPRSPDEVLAGTVISASLVTGLDSDLPGTVIAQVTENVYDTVSGHILLIPQGTRLIGQYDSVVAFGQSRALLVWQRMILPDGSSLQIDNLPASDTSGYAGLADKVDYHTWALLKGVGLATLLGVTSVSGSSQDSDLVRAIRESAEQSANQAGEKIVAKHLDVQPSITVRLGWPVRVIVHKDLVLKPYFAEN